MAGRIYVEELHPRLAAWLEFEPPDDWVLFLHPSLSDHQRKRLERLTSRELQRLHAEHDHGELTRAPVLVPLTTIAGAFS